MCNALEEVVKQGLLQIIDFSNENSEDADWMLSFVDPDEDDQKPIYKFNFCPFCGKPFQNGKPTCGDTWGQRTERFANVPG